MAKTVVKRWGKEDIFVNNELYCGKFLHFKRFYPCSLHMHREKTETFYVLKGRFQIDLVDMAEESCETIYLNQGHTLDIKPYLYHRIMGIEDDNVLLEVSTHDEPEDSYRFNDQEDVDMMRNKEFARQCDRIAIPILLTSEEGQLCAADRLCTNMVDDLDKLFCDGHHPDYNAAELEELAADCGLNRGD